MSDVVMLPLKLQQFHWFKMAHKSQIHQTINNTHKNLSAFCLSNIFKDTCAATSHQCREKKDPWQADDTAVLYTHKQLFQMMDICHGYLSAVVVFPQWTMDPQPKTVIGQV